MAKKSTVNKAGNYTKPGMRKQSLIGLKHKHLMVQVQVNGQLEKHKH